MKALILAAGYGTRLEPLTHAVPKPMVPIVNLPTMQHNLELLRHHSFTDVVANIHYFPEQIENYFGDGHNFGVNLTYSFEEQLLGTAGGVKRMADLAGVNDTFVVLSSDALTDINFQRMIKYHKEKKALVTIALSQVKDVRQYGVAVQAEDGRVIEFQEKPNPEETKSDQANAGIYIFEPEILKMIPDGFYDYGKQLFPKLVKEAAAIYGYKMVEYWSDVGGLEKYILSNYDAMRGLVRINIPGRRICESTWIGERQNIGSTARFEGSVIIGDRCTIGENVYIKDAIIGDKCVVQEGAVVTGSVIWSDTMIGKEAQVSHSVVGNWCHIGDKARIVDGSIVSNRCVIRNESEVPSRSRLEPNSII